MPVTPHQLPSSVTPRNIDEPGFLDKALQFGIREGENTKQAFMDVVAGFSRSLGGANDLTANAFEILDKGSDFISNATGTKKGEAFSRLEQRFRQHAESAEEFAQGIEGQGIGSKVNQIIGSLFVEIPKAGAAVGLGGPIFGFAGLGALERADEGLAAAAEGAVEGAALGGIFKATAPLAPLARGTAVGGAVTTSGLVSGEAPEDAVLGGLTLGILAGGTSKGRVKPGARVAEKLQEFRSLRALDRLKRGKDALPEGQLQGEAKAGLVKRTTEIRIDGKPQEIEFESFIRVTPRTEAVVTEFLGKNVADLELPDRVVNLNLNRIRSSKDLRKMQAELTQLYKPEIDDARRGEISFNQTKRLARDLNMTPMELIKRRKGQIFNAEEVTAARKINQAVMQEFSAVAERVRSPQGTAEDKLQLMRLGSIYEATVSSTLGAEAEIGRSLSALRMSVRGEKLQMQQIRDLVRQFQGATGKEIETFADMVLQKTDPAQRGQFIRDSQKATTGDKLIEFWIMGLLSNPTTQVVNVTSNAMIATYTIPETYLAAAIGAVRRTPGRVRFREGNARLFGLLQGAREGARLAAGVLRTGDPVSASEKVESLRFKAIAGRKGEVIRLPGRFLFAGDAFFKAIGSRQEINALSMRKALNEGLRGRAASRRVHELTEQFRQRQEFIKREAELPEELDTTFMRKLDEASFENAQYQTFTNELGRTGRAFQAIRNSHPAAALIMPFVRTPTNIVKFALQRTPLGLASKERLSRIRQGGPVGDTEAARIAFSSALMAFIATMQASGRITGGGPENPALRGAWFAAGFQPYSIRIGDTFTSYARLEPLGSIVGMAADLAEIMGNISNKDADEIAAAIVVSMSRNFTDKTFFTGITNLAAVLDEPDRFGAAFVRQMAGSAVPAGLAQLERVLDPTLRDARNTLDQIKSRIPGLSKSVPDRKNIWGEPIMLKGGLGPDLASPFYQNTLSPDVVNREAARVGAKLRHPDRKQLGVELTPDEFSELTGITGRLAKRTVSGFILGPVYRSTSITDAFRAEVIENMYAQARFSGREVFLADLIQKDPIRFAQPQIDAFNRLFREEEP